MNTPPSELLPAIGHFIDGLGDLAPTTLAFLILIAVNLLLRATPDISNKWIPWISVGVGMFIFPFYMPTVTSFKNPLGRNIGLGFVVGVTSAVCYKGIVKFAEKKWPWLHEVLNSNGSPKPKPNENDHNKNPDGSGVPGTDDVPNDKPDNGV